MELLGIEGLLASFDARKPWLELRSTAARWNDDPIYQRVRNKIAFHLDPAAVRAGINRPSRESKPVLWKTGNTKRDRSSTFNFAQDCLLSAVFPEEVTEEAAHKYFGAFCERVRDAHLGFSSWTQELFISAVRGATLGLKLTPLKRPTFEGLSLERLDVIGEMVAGMPSGSMKDAVLELLSEIGRLGGLVKRLQNDPGLSEAQRRREDEERRLRAIAATAKEYRANRAPGAEKRLQELLGIEAEP